MLKFIETKDAPQAIGPYSQAVMAGQTLYISGQTPLNPKTMSIISQDVKEQTYQCLSNIKAIAEEAGYQVQDIVKCGVFLQSMTDFKAMNEVYADFFKDHKPARVTIEAARLPLNSLVEIDAICYK